MWKGPPQRERQGCRIHSTLEEHVMSIISPRTSRTTLRGAAVAVATAALVTMGPACGSASAREPLPPTQVEASGPYSTPLDALGGLTLAQYVARHQERVLGLVGV
jgi:hypothetical protein